MSQPDDAIVWWRFIIFGLGLMVLIRYMTKNNKKVIRNRDNPVSNHERPTEPEVAQTSVEMSSSIPLDYGLNRIERESPTRSSVSYSIPSCNDQPPPSYDEAMASVQRND